MMQATDYADFNLIDDVTNEKITVLVECQSNQAECQVRTHPGYKGSTLLARFCLDLHNGKLQIIVDDIDPNRVDDGPKQIIELYSEQTGDGKPANKPTIQHAINRGTETSE